MISSAPKVGSSALFAVGDHVYSETSGRKGLVTSCCWRQDLTEVGNVWAWYYRVRWSGKKKDEGLFHETYIVAANLRVS